MAIKGIGFDLMSAYNRIGVNDRTEAAPVNESAKSQEVKPVEAQSASSEDLSGVKVNLNFDSIKGRPDLSLDDVSRKPSFSFNTFSISEQDMKSAMDKAVADMEKDSSLKQYQYFVGDSNIITDDEDGLVFIK